MRVLGLQTQTLFLRESRRERGEAAGREGNEQGEREGAGREGKEQGERERNRERGTGAGT